MAKSSKSSSKKGEAESKKNINLNSPFVGMSFDTLFADQNMDAKQLIGRYIGWVYTSIRAIANQLAAIELKLLRVNGEEVEEVDSHPALDLLMNPNPNQTFSTIMNTEEIHKLLTGEAYWFLWKENGVLREIRPLRPDRVRAVPGDFKTGEFVKEYEYRAPDGQPQSIPTDQMVPFLLVHPESPYFGMGVVEAAMRTANLELAGDDFNSAFFKNAASTGSVFEFEGDISEEAKKRLVAAFEQQYTGLKKSHKTIIVDNGGKYKEAGRTQRDMEFHQMSQWTRDKLLAMFQVSKAIIGITEDVNRANAEASEFIFSKRVIKPEMMNFVDSLNKFFLPQFEGTENLFFDFADPVPADEEAETQQIKALTNVTWTINEGRQKQGLDPIGPAGDFIYIPLNVAPIGEGAPEPTDETVDQAEEEEQVQEDRGFIKIPGKPVIKKLTTDYGDQQIKRVKGSSDYQDFMLIKTRAEAITKAAVQAMKDNRVYAEEKKMDAYWKQLVEDNETYESQLRRVLKRIFNREEQEIVRRLRRDGSKSLGKHSEKTLGDVFRYLANSKFLKRIMATEAKPILTRANQAQGRRAATLIAEEGYVFDDAARKQIDEDVDRFTREVSKTRTRELKRILERAQTEGLSIPEVTTEIRSYYTRYDKFSAQRIARSEVLRAANQASVRRWEQSGIVAGKQWFTAADERVCEWCGPKHGEVIPLDGTYEKFGTDLVGREGGILQINYTAIDEPPLHPQCRCTVAPVIGDQAFADILASTEVPNNKKEEPKEEKSIDIKEPSPEIQAQVEEMKEQNEKLKEQNEALQQDLNQVINIISDEEENDG